MTHPMSLDLVRRLLMPVIAALTGLALATCADRAAADTLRANPDTLRARLEAARPGDTVVLDQNALYGDVTLPRRDHPTPVEIVAKGAQLRSLTVSGTAGWRWLGGTIDSPLPPAVWRNVTIEDARRIELAEVTLSGGHTGVLVTAGSSEVVLRGNIATGLQSDGFNIATATRVSLIDNICRDFKPVPSVWRGDTLVTDGTHPDCIQLWSEAGKPPTSDIDIIGNRAEGLTQGIAHYWHPQMGRDKIYRVKAWRNEVIADGFWGGILLEGVAGADVRSNTVRAATGAKALGRPHLKVDARLTADADAVRCGNAVEGGKADKTC